jgi:hypothetical protein
MPSKKKFKDTKVGQFLLEKIPNIVGKIANETPVGTVIEAIIGGSEMSEADKRIALEKLKLERAEMDGVTQRWVADSQSSWLAQNVRPLTLVFFSISYVVGWYLEYPLDSITGLLSVVIGGYFGSRGVEKVMGNKFHS